MPLSGDQLPDSAARASASATASGAAGGSGNASGGAGSSDPAATRNVMLGALTLAAATVLVVAGRRALRRKS
ncbi:hypothetical protein [Actinacidiphila oryziradicis]|uniref:hypothetical protein n=1 Tax=Actinacidiphila oryziradicis TaxID=2571141 RepID=UPI0023F14C3A|nr:hypothetical protein [Actinacidiphila oryziradicis]